MFELFFDVVGRGKGVGGLASSVEPFDGRGDFALYSTGFAPSCMDIGDVERVDEFTRGLRTGVRNQVNFAMTGFMDIPMVRLDRDVMLEQRAGFGTSIDAPLQRALFIRKTAVHLACAHGQQLRLHVGGTPANMAARPREPQGQQRLETF